MTPDPTAAVPPSVARSLGWLGAGSAGVLLAGFVAGEAVGLPDHLDGLGPSAPAVLTGLAGAALLAVDLVLPVPSSAVMTALGARFGVVVGTLLSTLGGMASLWLGGCIGRRLAGAVHVERTARAEGWVDRYGAWAVLASRPLPLLAEAVAITAGASGMPRGRFLVAGAAGLLPYSLLCAIGGAALGWR